MLKSLIFSFFILSAIISDCSRAEKTDCTDVACTMEFRSINILVRLSKDNSAVILSSYKVLRVSDKRDITIADNDLNDNQGYYPLINDSYDEMLRFKDVEVEFQGFIGSQLVVDKRFIVTADCCHISLVSGDTEVYI